MGALLTLPGGAIANIARQIVLDRVAALCEVTITGRLIAIACRLIAIGRCLIATRGRLVTVAGCLTAVHRGRVALRAPRY
jgi:hypothetical protein